MRKIILFICIILIGFIIIPNYNYAQSSVKKKRADFYTQIDSLIYNPENLKLKYRSWSKDKDSLKVLYDELIKTYEEVYTDINNSQRLYWLYELSTIEAEMGYVEKAIETSKEALGIIKQKDGVYIAFSSVLANAYRHSGRKQKSNDIYLEILKHPLFENDSARQMSLNTIISENYENIGDYESATELCMKLYDYNLRHNRLAPASYNLIQLGRCAAYIEVDTSYFEYYHMAIELGLQSGDSSRVSNNYVNIGKAYRDAGFKLKGLEYLKKAEKLYLHESPFGRVHMISALCNVYYCLDSLETAFKYNKKLFRDAKKINAHNHEYYACMNFVNYYTMKTQYDSAQYYLLLAKEFYNGIENQDTYQLIYKKLSEINEKLENYPLAMAYLDSSYMEYEKFICNTNRDKLASLRIKSDYLIHRSKIKQLVTKNRLALARNTRLFILVISVLLALIITSYFTMIFRRRYRELQESYVNLVKKNIEMDKLNKQLHDCEVKPQKKVKADINGRDDEIVKCLKKMMNEDELFVNSNLSLKSLADKLNTNTSYLSAIINSHFHCNLPSLINKYRINKARELLVSPEFEHYSMEGIALEVGFKSRSGFYHSFKTITGLSPSLYIKNYNVLIAEENG